MDTFHVSEQVRSPVELYRTFFTFKFWTFMNCFHVIPKIINGTASERTLIALNIFFMHPGHMPVKVVLTRRLHSHILHAISSFSFSKKISLELSGNKTSSSSSILGTVKQPPPNIFSMSKHSWNMDIFHMYCKILFRFRFIVTFNTLDSLPTIMGNIDVFL